MRVDRASGGDYPSKTPLTRESFRLVLLKKKSQPPFSAEIFTIRPLLVTSKQFQAVLRQFFVSGSECLLMPSEYLLMCSLGLFVRSECLLMF